MNSFLLLSSALVSADPCTNGACGVPVNVSPLIAQGKIAEAKAAIHVTGIGMVCVIRFLSANTNTPSDTCGSSPVVVAIFHFHSNPLTPPALSIPETPDPLFEGSYSGLVTSDAAKKDSIFFWYLPAQCEQGQGECIAGEYAPTMVWLQGGPGAPSTYGMFTEIGPVIVQDDGTVMARNNTWNEQISILVVDNPSGVGYSPLGTHVRV